MRIKYLCLTNSKNMNELEFYNKLYSSKGKNIEKDLKAFIKAKKSHSKLNK